MHIFIVCYCTYMYIYIYIYTHWRAYSEVCVLGGHEPPGAGLIATSAARHTPYL